MELMICRELVMFTGGFSRGISVQLKYSCLWICTKPFLAVFRNAKDNHFNG